MTALWLLLGLLPHILFWCGVGALVAFWLKFKDYDLRRKEG